MLCGQLYFVIENFVEIFRSFQFCGLNLRKERVGAELQERTRFNNLSVFKDKYSVTVRDIEERVSNQKDCFLFEIVHDGH